jgi:hypothetical protein
VRFVLLLAVCITAAACLIALAFGLALATIKQDILVFGLFGLLVAYVVDAILKRRPPRPTPPETKAPDVKPYGAP